MKAVLSAKGKMDIISSSYWLVHPSSIHICMFAYVEHSRERMEGQAKVSGHSNRHNWEAEEGPG